MNSEKFQVLCFKKLTMGKIQMLKQRGSVENEVAFSVMVVAAFAILVYVLSRKLGADYAVTLDASWRTILLLVVVLAINYFLSWGFIIEGLLAWLALSWLFWWDVLDNVYSKSIEYAWYYDQSQVVWWNATWFKVGVEIGILALLTYYIFKRKN
jgi:hypothetical protein